MSGFKLLTLQLGNKAGSLPLCLVQRNENTQSITDVFIDDSSGLALLVGLFTSMSDGESEHIDVQSKRASRSNKQQSSKQQNASKELTMSISTLNKQIKANAGDTWNAIYKGELGTLNDFLKQHEDIFRVNGQLVTLKVPKSVIRLLPMSEIQFLLPPIAADPTGPLDKAEKSEFETQAEQDIDMKRLEAEHKDLADAIAQDEEFAKELSRELNSSGRKSSENRTEDKSVDTDGEWQTSTRSKKKKGLQPEAVTSPEADEQRAVDDSGNDAEQSTASANRDAQLQRRIRIRKIAQQIVSKYHGNFFEFNDSEVTSLPFEGLKRAIEGQNTAYLLVYRRMGDGGKLLLPNSRHADVRNHRSGSDTMDVVDEANAPSIPVPMPPRYWREKVTEWNNALSAQRSSFELQSHLATLRIYCPSRLSVDYPLLHPTKASSNGESRVEEAYIEFEFDLRLTMQENLDRFLIDHSDRLLELGLVEVEKPEKAVSNEAKGVATGKTTSKGKQNPKASGNRKSPMPATPTKQQTVPTSPTVSADLLSMSKLCLSELMPCGGGFFPRSPAASNTVAVDVVTRGTYYLVWNGSTINEVKVTHGAESAPVKLSMSLLSPDTAGSLGSRGAKTTGKKAKSTGMPPTPATVMTIEDFWVPRTASVSECCRLMAKKCELDIDTTVVHLVDKKMGAVKASSSTAASGDDSAILGSTRSTERYLKSKQQVKELTAVLIWAGTGGGTGNGNVSFTGSACTSANTNKSVQASSSTMTVAELIDDSVGYFYGTELLIEDLTARGMYTRSLAEAEIAHRNATIDVYIDINFNAMEFFSKLLAPDSTPAVNVEEDEDCLGLGILDENKAVAVQSAINLGVNVVKVRKMLKKLRMLWRCFIAHEFLVFQIQIERDCTGSRFKQLVFEQLKPKQLPESLTLEMFRSHTRLRVGKLHDNSPRCYLEAVWLCR
jgi:hypothetical protein